MFHVYTKPNCTYCDQAKQLLTSRNLPFKAINLDIGQTKVEGEEYISRDELLGLFPGARTMPQVALVRDGNFQPIGGYAELRGTIG